MKLILYISCNIVETVSDNQGNIKTITSTEKGFDGHCVIS